MWSGSWRWPEDTTALTALARVWVSGGAVDWAATAPGGRRTALPTYPFDRTPYWPTPTPATTAGHDATGHPLLTAAVHTPDGGLLLTGRLTRHTHPWLADHTVLGSTLLPGTGFVELALRAGEAAGCPHLHELTLAAPLVVPDHGAVTLQVTVGAPGDDDRRTVTVHSRTGEDTGWTRHTPTAASPPPAPARHRPPTSRPGPPPHAAPADLTDAHDRLAARGFDYGPAFRGLTAAWTTDDGIHAEIALPDGTGADHYGIHPALLDTALHAAMLHNGGDDTVVPFVWNDVTLHATAPRPPAPTSSAPATPSCGSPSPTPPAPRC
nr:polyketide synthase dehydratase domain-containing protein [Pseudonocardia sp. ICBG601]